jgi:Tol biopolymer transport system component
MNGYAPRNLRSRHPISLAVCVVLAAACGSTATPEASGGGASTSPIDASPSSEASPVATRAVEVTERPIDLTTLSGRIAFSAGAPNAEDVYIVNADGSGVVKVTSERFAEFDPSWAPDGTRVAYRHQTDVDWDSTEIYVIGIDGTDAHDISHNDGPPDWGPSWSPDGSTIGWNTVRSDASGFQLGLTDPGGSHFRLVNPGVWVEYPAWSPDGTRIAFMSQTPEGSENYEIVVMNTDGTNPVRLTDSAGPDGWPTWSPDGRKIAFTSVRDDCSFSDAPDCLSTGDIGPFHTLWVMNADGSDQHRVSRRFVQIPDWSPDGRYIVFGTRSGLGIVSTDGAAYTELPLGLSDPSFPEWLK